MNQMQQQFSSIALLQVEPVCPLYFLSFYLFLLIRPFKYLKYVYPEYLSYIAVKSSNFIVFGLQIWLQ